MSWQELVLLNALFTAGGTIITRLLARDKHNQGSSFVMNAGQFIFLWLLGLLILPLLGHPHVHVLGQYLWRFAGGGLAFALSYTCTYKSLTYLDAAIGSIFGTLNALFTIGLAALVLREELSSMQLIGAIVLTGAIIYTILAIRARKNKTVHSDILHGLGYAVLAGAIYAVAIVNEKSLLQVMSTADYVLFGWGWQMLASVLVAAVLQPRRFVLLLRPQTLGLIASAAILRGIGGAAFVLAQVRSDNVALVTVISNFRLVVVVILGAWLLRERERLARKITGSLAALIGLTIMFWK